MTQGQGQGGYQQQSKPRHARIYVSTNGNDANTGKSRAVPVRTVAHAVTLAGSGGMVALMAGGVMFEDIRFDAPWHLVGADSGGALINATNTVNAIRPVLHGRIYFPPGGVGSSISQVSNFGVAADGSINQDPSPIVNDQNIELAYCGFTNNNYEGDGTINGLKVAVNAGTGGTNASGIHIHHCEFFDVGGLAHRLRTDAQPSGWFAHAVYLVNCPTGVSVHDNLFHGVSGSAIQFFGTGAASGVTGTIRNNTFSTCGAAHTLDESVTNVTWTKNIFETCSMSVTQAFTLGPDGGAYSGVSIDDNIFHGNTNGDYGSGGGLALPNTGITITNVRSIDPQLSATYKPANQAAAGYGPDWLQP